MQKIMFNNTYGLTDSVKKGIKTATTRFEPRLDGVEKGDFLMFPRQGKIVIYGEKGTPIETIPMKYKVGEVVAVAEPYKETHPNADFTMIGDEFITESAGWNNKMFVKSETMPYRICMHSAKIERLQDISEIDCYKEGVIVFMVNNTFSMIGETRCTFRNLKASFDNPKDAFAMLIDKINGKGTWESNPWVIRYYFELRKQQ